MEIGENLGGDFLIQFAGRPSRRSADRLIAFDDIVHVGYVDVVVGYAVHDGHVRIDLQDDVLRRVEDLLLAAVRQAEGEIPLPVHRRYGNHGHVDGGESPFVVGAAVAEQHGLMIGSSLVQVFPVDGRAVPYVVGKGLVIWVLLQHLYGPAGHAAPDLDVFELAPPAGQGLVQGCRKGAAMAVIYPVAVLYNLYRLLRRAELFSVLAVYVHRITSR